MVQQMADHKEKQEKKKHSVNNPTHATIMAVVGGYIIYMAYRMLKNSAMGNTQMSLNTTYLMAGLLALGGIAVIGYGIYNMVVFTKKAKEISEHEQECDEE